MINDNHNSACGFAEDLMSYLYGEIGAVEKAKFETHLFDCKPCADDLTAFGAVRSAVLDWREKDFAPLRTPSIELPFPEKSASATVETISNSRSWLSGLRELFSLSPVWAGAAAACAALVICAGLFYVAVSSLRSNGGYEISGVNKNTSVVNKTVPSPTVEGIVPPQNADIDKNVSPDKSPKPEIAQNPKSTTATNKSAATPVSDKKALPDKTKVLPKAAKKDVVNSPRTPRRNDIRLTDEEDDEDKSLRLTDLFDEISER